MGSASALHVLTQKPLDDGTGLDLTGECPVVISFTQTKLCSSLALKGALRRVQLFWRYK